MFENDPIDKAYKTLNELREFRRLFINNTKKGYLNLSTIEYLNFRDKLDLEIKKLSDILPF